MRIVDGVFEFVELFEKKRFLSVGFGLFLLFDADLFVEIDPIVFSIDFIGNLFELR